MESSSTLTNMAFRSPTQHPGEKFVLRHGDRSSLCECCCGQKKISMKEKSSGRFRRGSCVQLHPWMVLGELCNWIAGIGLFGRKYHLYTDQN